MPIQDAPPYDYIESGNPSIPQDAFELSLLQNADQPGTRTIAYGGVPDATQYRQELQRAQAGNGFINADVGPGGEVITPGRDPVLDDLRQGKAQELAMRYKGQQLYKSLVDGGATPAEAYRASGHLLNYSNPIKQVQLDAMLARQQPLQPEVRTVDGVKLIRSGPHSWSRVPEARPAATARVQLPLDVAAQQKIAAAKITDTRQDLERAKKELELDPGNADAARRARIYQESLGALEQDLVKGSTNWMGQASGPVNPIQATATTTKQAEAVTPFKEGAIIKNRKDGKLYKVVNGVPVAVD
jgi:hypothetical protein